MKISEMTNDQATETMIRLCGPFSAICDDNDMLEIIDELSAASEKNPDMKPIQQMARFLPKIVTFCFTKHKNDLYEIIGALQMVPTSMIGKMNFIETLNVIKNSYDEILAGFFTHSAAAEKIKGKASA